MKTNPRWLMAVEKWRQCLLQMLEGLLEVLEEEEEMIHQKRMQSSLP
jgi:hypothetical protein